ncbi:hypothetical protein FB45DRAFT_858713 [Roridomyces roridus]|uniref:Uncharacterized protein n=1 Tax=Roridomyces roridus TaxID=1738132 RepID=A0AAD7FY85_9AGAR|nr:hypothetical protein FB45DRAFT_858713 [Roridomyces roridus]
MASAHEVVSLRPLQGVNRRSVSVSVDWLLLSHYENPTTLSRNQGRHHWCWRDNELSGRDGTLINFVGSFADEDQEQPDWGSSATRQDVLDKFHDAHPKFLRLLDLPIVSPILKWKLRDTMAIEDAGALGVQLPLGDTEEGARGESRQQGISGACCDFSEPGFISILDRERWFHSGYPARAGFNSVIQLRLRFGDQANSLRQSPGTFFVIPAASVVQHDVS